MGHFSRIRSEVAEMEADFRFDARLDRRWKRKDSKLYSRSNKAPKKTLKNSNKENDVDMEIVSIDSDYDTFLNDMEHLVVADDVDSADDNVNCNRPVTVVESDDGDILDPQYRIFLENLKEDGNSYLLTLPLGNDTHLVVKYEKEDELDLENLETVKGFAVQENITSENILQGVSKRQNIEGSRRISETISGIEKIENPSKFLRSDSRRENDETFSNLHYVVEKTQNPKTFGNALRKKNMEAQKTLKNVPMTDRKTLAVEKNVEVEAESQFHCTTNDCESNLMDESYQAFLDSLEEVGQNIVYAPEGGEKVVYEKDGASDSDSEVIILDNNPCFEGDYTPFVPSKSYVFLVDGDDEGCTGSPAGSKESQFREKLMEILQKPYDHNEFKHLMREASQKRPKEGCRELRGGTITWTLESLGKSYLEEYSDLATKINEVCDDLHRALNLLRGFFYWLKNLTFGGAFRPWLDASCLKALPQA